MGTITTELIPISREVFNSGKFRDIVHQGTQIFAKVQMDDGVITQASYSDKYLKSLNKTSSHERKMMKKGGKKSSCGICCLCKCLLKVFCYFLPFAVQVKMDEDD